MAQLYGVTSRREKAQGTRHKGQGTWSGNKTRQGTEEVKIKGREEGETRLKGRGAQTHLNDFSANDIVRS